MAVFFVLLTLILCSSHHHVVEGSLKINKQANVETVCVGIYKQPALNHPALRNHKIQMKPTFLHKSEKFKVSSMNAIFENTISCPTGMVPIQRLRNNTISQSQDIHPLTQEQHYYHYALLQTNEEEIYHGGRAVINIQNPRVEENQYSMASITLEAGSAENIESIGVGWAVNPSLYGDSKTRATGFWKVGKRGCYNTLCPGFVQVDKTNILGEAFKLISIPGGIQVDIEYMIAQDKTTGHWWVTINKDDLKIGYWPKELFTSLESRTNKVKFGGSVLGSPESGLSPPMGSGKFPDRDFNTSSYLEVLKVVREDYNLGDVDSSEVDEVVSNSSCYNVKNWYYQGPTMRYTMAYGGPGGMCGMSFYSI